MVELLAPVGSKEALAAAVEAGADAVYLAGKAFGARSYASNFDRVELAEAIRFAHLRGVLVDVAVNTIVDQSEFEELADYLRFLYEAGADAAIVQDLGVAYLAQAVVPNLPLHASTQMTVHTLEGVHFLQSLGFERVVLSRELSLEDIQLICSNTDIEIEVFIHGALCICYSGQCLMSGMIGGRSGNRGCCAQPCRLPYTLTDKEGTALLLSETAGEYLLSPKDMNTLHLIPRLLEAGVTSLKIEGRMKRPEYVAVVVDTYRRVIDRYAKERQSFHVMPEEEKNLAQIFNRDFTTAYLLQKEGRRMMSDRRPNNRGVLAGRVVRYDAKSRMVALKLVENLAVGDILEFWVKVGGRVSATIRELYVGKESVTKAAAGQTVWFLTDKPVRDHDRAFKVYDAALMKHAQAFFRTSSALRRIPLDMEIIAEAGRPMTVSLCDADGNRVVEKTAFIAEAAQKRPLTEEAIRKQMERLGTTVFELREFHCQIKGEIMVPVSEINEVRRKAADRLEHVRLQKFSRPAPPVKSPVQILRELLPASKEKAKRGFKLQLSVQADTVEKVAAALKAGADAILFGGERYGHQAIAPVEYETVCGLVKAAGKLIFFQTPRIAEMQELKGLKKLWAQFRQIRPDAVSVGNVGTFFIVREELGLPILADTPFNIYNPLTIAYLQSLGAEAVTLSPELNFSQVERIAEKSPLPVECIVHGHLPLMVSKYCMLGSFLGGLNPNACSQPCEKQRCYLLDRKGERFPLVTDPYCRMHVLNGKELSMFAHVERFVQSGVSRIRIEGKYMDEKKVAKVTKLYRELIDLGAKHPILKEGELEKLEGATITRGHYFRGILAANGADVKSKTV